MPPEVPLLVGNSLRWFIANFFALYLDDRAHMAGATRSAAVFADRQSINWPRPAHAKSIWLKVFAAMYWIVLV